MTNHKKFSFPLNVYAHCLQIEHGRFDYLHYGLFDSSSDTIVIAQKQASDYLFNHLPASPCRILEVGIGIGTTLTRIRQSGYAAMGITPDATQIQYAKSRYGDDLPVTCSRLKDFTNLTKFDLLLFQESAQYISTPALFDKANELLNRQGRILIMDEVSIIKKSTADGGLPSIEEYERLGSSAGFVRKKFVDLSSRATMTNNVILASVKRNRSQLIEELELLPEALDLLVESAEAYLEKYTSGQYGYALMEFDRVSGFKHAVRRFFGA